MNLAKLIDRPILSCVISTFIVLVGLISLAGLPVEKYPDIAPPQVVISTSYPGASAEVIKKSVIMPIEEAVNGVEDMLYIQSNASNSGIIEINVFFKQGADADKAAVNVQNRVAKVTALLPAEVTKMGVAAQKQQPSMLRVFAIYSPTDKYDANFVSNFMWNTIRPAIQRIDGVGNVNVLTNKYGMRIWLNPSKMVEYGLVPNDIAAVLADQNIEAPLGIVGANSSQVFQYSMKFKGRRVSEEEFGDIVIKTLPDGGALHMRDISTIELGMEDYTFNSEVSGHPASVAIVYQSAGSNATQINNDITSFFKDELQLPDGLEIMELENGNDFLFAAIDNVVETLVVAIILVVIVVFFFLQDWRATLIPTISIMVALIGTFVFLQVMGWTLNLLTLFSLVLVIGTVVDDSITVVEAVQERFEVGFKSSIAATKSAISSVSQALFTTTLVFVVVFIPVSFMSGTTGIFYRQFGLTMAVAVVISTINAMTLSPALASLLMKPVDEEHEGRFMRMTRRAYTVSYTALYNSYVKKASFFINHKFLVGVCVVAGCALLFWTISITPTGMVPEEDKGSVYIDVTCPMGTSLNQTSATIAEVQKVVESIPEVGECVSISGYGLMSGTSSSSGTLFVRLKPWDQRDNGFWSTVNGVIAKIYMQTANIKGATVFAMAPPMIDGYGSGNTIDFWMQDRQDRDIKDFQRLTAEFCQRLQECPEVSMAYCSYAVDYPQLLLDIDAEMCQRRGISPSEVLSCIGGYYSGQYWSNFNRFSKIYRVMVMADPSRIADINSLSGIYVRLRSGEMAPVSQFVTVKKVYEPMELKRFNLYSAIPVNAMPADGYSSGDCIRAIEELKSEMLPSGYSIEYAGMAREQKSNGSGGLGVVLAICVLFVYLVMCALYESLFIPLAVLLSVPVGLAGTFVFAKVFSFIGMFSGQTPINNDIYLQVAVVMLIGLLAKTAILLTEYATQCRQAGMSLLQSANFAAKVRLRPILMTVLTMIFGMIPMIVATGQGANGNRTIGIATVGGSVFGTLSLLFFVPAMFIVMQTIQEKFKPVRFEKCDDKLINDEVERLVANGELTLPPCLQTISTGDDNTNANNGNDL